MSNIKLKATRKEVEIIKSFFQIQILLETMDEVYYSTMFHIKGATSTYLEILKNQAEPILESMHKTNPSLYLDVTKKLRKSVSSIDSYFEIIN